MNPNPSDTLCLSQIERAKSDIAIGKIVLTQSYGFGTSSFRYEKELKKICKEYGLTFDKELIGCVVFEGQTEGCYGDFMTNTIIEKFGIDHIENMHKQADSLFILNTNNQNLAVEYWDCDERPRLPTENERSSDYIPSINVKGVGIKKSNEVHGGWPFFDLGFIVEKDSTVSNFYSRGFVAQLEANKKYEDKLFNISVDYIKTQYSIWIPGTINGIPVRTNNNVRIFLIGEE